MRHLNRRTLLAGCGAAALSLTASATEAPPSRKITVVAGAHPGDPEAGCGVTIARYTREGHEVIALYLTRGEAGVSGKSAEQAAAIRTAEAEAACKVLGARAVFAGQIDGATEVTATRAAEFTRLLGQLNPDVVFTQWPVDNHADHRACAALTHAAWLGCGRKFALYYYEVDLGSDTQCFRPVHFVDVTVTEPLKRDACMAHHSQNPAGFYEKDHVPMMHFRGMECGRKLAEAFIHHDQSPAGLLPDG